MGTIFSATLRFPKRFEQPEKDWFPAKENKFAQEILFITNVFVSIQEHFLRAGKTAYYFQHPVFVVVAAYLKLSVASLTVELDWSFAGIIKLIKELRNTIWIESMLLHFYIISYYQLSAT